MATRFVTGNKRQRVGAFELARLWQEKNLVPWQLASTKIRYSTFYERKPSEKTPVMLYTCFLQKNLKNHNKYIGQKLDEKMSIFLGWGHPLFAH